MGPGHLQRQARQGAHMYKRVGVLFVHGLGGVADDYSHDTISELRERIAGRGLNRDEIAWQAVYWNHLLSEKENRLWVDLSSGNDLNWAKLRKFFIHAFGTVNAYRSADRSPGSLYRRIHETVRDSVKELRGKLGDQDKPLLIVAHSFGSMIMSDYIWDRQKGKDQELFGATAFERMETLSGMVTMGSNIPLCTAGLDAVTAIDFPPPTLAAPLSSKARWLNLYDSDDVLGWPLKPLSDSYSKVVSDDMEVSVGNILTAWNPTNHAAYWNDDTVIKPTLYLLASILEATHVKPKPEVRESNMGYPD